MLEDRVPGEPFVPKPSKDTEKDKVLRYMQGMQVIAPGMELESADDIEEYKN